MGLSSASAWRAAPYGVLVLVGALMPACAPAVTAVSPEAPDLYQWLRRACVEVIAEGRLEGSGWFADSQGLVVTAGHVVHNKPQRLEVLWMGARLPAEVVAVDRGHDLALLRVPGGVEPYPMLPVAPRAPAPGEEVLLFGGPLFRHGLLLSGKVARQTPTYEFVASQHCYARCFHISGPSPMGTSGGCWVDRQGRVVGNQSGYLGQDMVTVGVAYASPPEAIAQLVTTRKSAATPTLAGAFEELWEQPREFIARFPAGSSGVVPVRIKKGGPLEQAGLKTDMLITGIDGQSVMYRDELLDAVRARSVGDEVTLTVREAGVEQPRQVKARLVRLEEE